MSQKNPEAEECKAQGNAAFKAKNYDEAIGHYQVCEAGDAQHTQQAGTPQNPPLPYRSSVVVGGVGLANTAAAAAATASGFSQSPIALPRPLLDAAPSLPPQVLHRMAQAYLRAQERSEPVSELDAILALAPWSSPAHQERYLQAIDESWLDEDPLRSLWLAAFLLGPAAIPRQIAYGPWDSLDDEARQLRLLAADVQRRFDDAMARREQEAEQTREGEGATDDAQG